MTDRKQWRTGASASFVGKLDEGVMEDYAKAEIKSLEISFRNPYYDEISWKDLPRWSRQTGTELWSIHLPFGRVSENIAYIDKEVCDATLVRHKDLIGRAGEAGMKIVVIHPSSEPIADRDRPLLLDRSAENLGILCERAAEFGMRVAVEDLPRTCLGNCHEDIRYLLDRNPTLGVCFDTNHLLKDTNTAFVRALGDRILTLHVSDYDFIDEKHVFPGEGLVDWKALQGELEQVDYDGPFMYEVSNKAPGSVDGTGSRTLADIRKNHLMLQNL